MLMKEVGDLRGQADTMVNLAHILRLQGKLKSAQFLYSKSLALFQAVGGRWNQATCLNGIGDILLLRGDYAEARARFEESLTLASKVSNQFERAAALTGLGQAAICLDDLQTASRYLRQSLELTREMQHTAGVAQLLLGLGDLERSQGYDKAAQAHYEQCLTLTKQIGDRVSMAHALYGLGEVARKQGEFASACTLLKQGIQLSWDIGDFPGLAVSLETFAIFCHQIHLPERAALFLGTTDALRDWLQIPLASTQLAEHEREVVALGTELGEGVFRETWTYGRTMTLKLAMSLVARIHLPVEQAAVFEKPPTNYPAGLTAREVDVLRLVAAGLPDARIAEQLVLSPRTVNSHLRSIYAKIGVSSRSAATRFAFEHKLI